MWRIWCVAALAWTLVGTLPAQNLRDAPLPAQISLVMDKGVLNFRDDNGNTLYVFDRDPAGASVCEDACARQWPPIAAPPDAHPIGDWTPVHRKDGTVQWAYKGRPVYTFLGDTGAGQTNGAGKGGGWRLLVP